MMEHTPWGVIVTILLLIFVFKWVLEDQDD